MEIGPQIIKINWKFRIIYSILIGLIYSGILCLMDYFIDNELQSVSRYIIQGVFFGIIMGFVFSYVVVSEKFGRRFTSIFGIKPELSENEQIEIEGPANLFRGIEGVGGKIFLTNKKIIFKSHKLNIQKGQTNIEYQNIQEVLKRKTVKLIDNGIRIITKNGTEFDFVINEREKWLENLNEKLK
ncbi:MAG: GRAM domain-containing protein [Marinifilum sp.]|jgi:hypothetical protein|nr:GRAM domain-containing protein [Marinifilum sp.]